MIDKSQAAAAARMDPGTGICGSFIHYKDQATPLSKLDEAITLLNKPKGDANVLDRVSQLLTNINFKNADPSAVGDFSPPNFNDVLFPYSTDPMANPPGNNNNIATRIRGYLNVPSNFGGNPVTFAVNCDDACSLKIGKSMVIPFADERISARVARQVSFKDPGLYAVEMVYYQNGSQAYLEWSRANSAEMEGNLLVAPQDFTTKFKLIPESELYSAIVGSNPSCQECATNTDCSMGNYCGDGLCQACNLPDHCGPSCITCPMNARICSQNKCVECTTDAHCAPGLSCDVPNGRCVPPTACTRDDDCKAQGKICDPDNNICVVPPTVCTDSKMCPAGQTCDTTRGYCRVPPMSCLTDADCPMNQYCDLAAMQCKPRNRYLYEGGLLLGCSMTPGQASKTSGTGLFGFAVLGLIALAFRKVARRRLAAAAPLGRLGALLGVLFFCFLSNTAHAQSGPISINTQIFQPALGPENIITVEGTRTPGKWVPMANALFEYAHQPLRIVDRQILNMQTINPVVPYMFTLHLMGGIGFTNWLSVGVDLPVVVYQAFERQTTPRTDVPNDPSSAGVGDLRLIGKFRILNNTEGGFGLAFVPQITFPTGNGAEFRGNEAFGFEPRLALDYRTKKGFIVALNLGVLLRTSDQQARNILVSHQVRYGLGAFLPLPKGFGLAGEVAGSTSFFNAENIYTPLEAYLGARWIHSSGINVNLGGGPGLTPVAGSAQFRLFASVGYLPIAHKKEAPKPKVVDLDPDHDGLIGRNDRCPEVWGPPENEGCPDVDTDKDGLVDRLDRCPKEPGPKENNGCPDGDRDGDGLVDRLDSCPDQPGPLENNGCPLLDTDKDGIPDKDDKCPYEPGPKENNGCPPARKYINVTQEKIELLQKILFATNKADIKPASFDLLNEVVSVMKSRPSMRVHIEGHTDARGTLAWNMKLSKMRAESVTKYIVEHGIEAERLTSEGYGPTRPLCKEKTNGCYDKNRRTEFVIVHQ